MGARAVSDLNVKLLKEEVGPEKENGLVDYVLLICKRRDDRSPGKRLPSARLCRFLSRHLEDIEPLVPSQLS